MIIWQGDFINLSNISKISASFTPGADYESIDANNKHIPGNVYRTIKRLPIVTYLSRFRKFFEANTLVLAYFYSRFK
jgi:hypothetical protein